MKEEYKLTLEAQEYININTDGVTSRVFKRSNTIDKYEITVGRDIAHDDEIIMSEGYANKHHIAIDSTIKIKDKEYKIVGYFLRPDYLYMLENVDDSYKNIDSFYLCYMSDDAFNELNAEDVEYLVRYSKDSDKLAFRKDIHSRYFINSYVSYANNNRIQFVYTQAKMFIAVSYITLPILPLIAVLLISIIISKKVKSEQKIIGSLTALGYTNKRIILHYSGFAVLPGIFGGILSTIFTMMFVQGFAELGLVDYEPMRIVGKLNPIIALIGLLGPSIAYMLTGMLSVRKLLKNNTVMLLNNVADTGKTRRRKLFINSKMSFSKKFALRSILSNPMRSFVVVLGIFLGCLIIVFSYSVVDTMKYNSDNAVDNIGSFNHFYLLKSLMDNNKYGGESLLIAEMECDENNSFLLIGTDNDNPYINLTDTNNNNKADLKDSYYITSLAAQVMGWKIGDTIDAYNPIVMKNFTFTVAGIIQNKVQKAVFTSRENISNVAGISSSKFNAIVSDNELNIPKSKIAKIISRESIAQESTHMRNEMSEMMNVMIALGILICIASVYIAVNMLITDNQYNISMLKVMGYSNKKINRIVLSINHILLPIGIVLALLCVYKLCDTMFLWWTDFGAVLLTTHIYPISFIISISITALCYFVSLALLSKKIKKADMVKSLKDNRE